MVSVCRSLVDIEGMPDQWIEELVQVRVLDTSECYDRFPFVLTVVVK